MKKNHILVLSLLMVGLLGGNLWAADPLYERFTSLINDTILPWTRMIGIIGTIATVVGLMKARSEQSENMMGWVKAIAFFVGVISLPEVFNWLISSGGNTKINFS